MRPLRLPQQRSGSVTKRRKDGELGTLVGMAVLIGLVVGILALLLPK